MSFFCIEKFIFSVVIFYVRKYILLIKKGERRIKVCFFLNKQILFYFVFIFQFLN